MINYDYRFEIASGNPPVALSPVQSQLCRHETARRPPKTKSGLKSLSVRTLHTFGGEGGTTTKPNQETSIMIPHLSVQSV